MAVDMIARALGGNALGQISHVDEKIIEWLEQLGFITLLYTDDDHVACDENGNPLIYRVNSGSGGGTIEETTSILAGDGNGNAVAAETEEAETVGIDAVVTKDSANLVTSGAVAAAISAAIGNIDTLVGSGVIA